MKEQTDRSRNEERGAFSHSSVGTKCAARFLSRHEQCASLLRFPVLPPQLADGRMTREREGRQRSLRSERENDFSETGGRDGRNRRFLIRPSERATASGGGECGFLPPKETDGETKRRTDGESWERNPERKNAIYSRATMPPQQPLSSTPPSLSATPKDRRRRTHCDSAATNTSRLKIHLGCGRQTIEEKEEGVTFVVI